LAVDFRDFCDLVAHWGRRRFSRFLAGQDDDKGCGIGLTHDSKREFMSFRALHLSPQILQAVQDSGYTEPTPIQVAAIPLILGEHDVIGIAQTGTGKTAAFVLPILMKLAESRRVTRSPGDLTDAASNHHSHPSKDRRAWPRPGSPQAGVVSSVRGPRALVLAPTRELVVQIDENVRAYAKHVPVRVATVFGGVSERPQIEALRSGVDIVVATPGRLIDLMEQRAANLSQVQFAVLDEADRMLDMGFLPPIRRIMKALPQRRQTLMFSATLSREIEALTHQFQQSPKVVEIGRRANPAEAVTQFVYEVRADLKPALLLHLLNDPNFDTVLVFSRTKHGADRIARRLESSGIKTGTIHSNRSQNQRLRALKDFKSGAVRVLVATDIAARGIDVDGISHVVNYDFPMHVEDYVHRIGRTGRAHAVGDAISFVTPEDHAELRALERFIGRGIVRKKAEGFNYSMPGPAQNPAGNQGRQQHPGGGNRHGESHRSGPSGPRHNGGHNGGGSARREHSQRRRWHS
jgi:ATP-dependent RNA helicase RhlE